MQGLGHIPSYNRLMLLEIGDCTAYAEQPIHHTAAESVALGRRGEKAISLAVERRDAARRRRFQSGVGEGSRGLRAIGLTLPSRRHPAGHGR